VHFDDRIVDVDHDPTGVDAGGQGCAIGESTQEPRRDSIEARGCVPRPRNCATTQRTLPHRGQWPHRWLPFVRGDLYGLRAPRDAGGHEQSGARYAVVFQSDDLPLSSGVIAPTSTLRPGWVNLPVDSAAQKCRPLIMHCRGCWHWNERPPRLAQVIGTTVRA